MSHHYALFSALYYPHPGGVESFTANVGRELAAQGNRVTVVTSQLDDSPAREVQDDGVEVVRLPCRALMGGRLPVSRRSSAYRELLAEVLSSQVDRVVVNTRFYRHSLEGLRFAKRADAKAVVLDHGSAYLVLGNPLYDAALRAYEHGITALGRRYQPTYAGVSNASTQWLRTFGIETTHIIPDAIDAQAFRAEASDRAFRDELGMGPECKMVAFVGRLTPEKGALQLAHAAQLLREDLDFVLAGEGPLRERIGGMRLPNVHLVGALTRADVSALMAQADLFCLPTRSEGFGLAFIEACAWGLVSVMPRVGVVGDVLDLSEGFGRIVPDTRPLTLAMALNEMVAQDMDGHSQDLRHHIEQTYSWRASAHALEACFE